METLVGNILKRDDAMLRTPSTPSTPCAPCTIHSHDVIKLIACSSQSFTVTMAPTTAEGNNLEGNNGTSTATKSSLNSTSTANEETNGTSLTRPNTVLNPTPKNASAISSSQSTAKPAAANKEKANIETPLRHQDNSASKKSRLTPSKTSIDCTGERAARLHDDTCKTVTMEIRTAMIPFTTMAILTEAELRLDKEATPTFYRTQCNHNHVDMSTVMECTNNLYDNPIKADLTGRVHTRKIGRDMDVLLVYNTKVNTLLTLALIFDFIKRNTIHLLVASL